MGETPGSGSPQEREDVGAVAFVGEGGGEGVVDTLLAVVSEVDDDARPGSEGGGDFDIHGGFDGGLQEVGFAAGFGVGGGHELLDGREAFAARGKRGHEFRERSAVGG